MPYDARDQLQGRSKVNLLAAISVGCFSGVVVPIVQKSFASRELLALVACGIVALLLFTVSVHRTERRDTMAQSVEAFGRRTMRGDLGWGFAASTACVAIVALCLAATFGRGHEWAISIVEGVRTGVFLLIGLKTWRLTPGGRVGLIVAWVAADLWIFSTVFYGPVVQAVTFPSLSIAAAIVTGSLLLNLQDQLDAWMGAVG